MMTMKFKGKTLSRKKLINNLFRYYDQATFEEFKEGMMWYMEANQFCKKLAERFECSLEQAAGILAAHSPQCGFEQNKRYAITSLSEPRKRVISTRQRTAKAQKIASLDGLETIHKALSVNEEGAPKTKAFFLNIVKPYESTTCTIDRHAIGCLLQHPSKVIALPNKMGDITVKQYEWFVDVYKEGAQKQGILVHQFQAILWTVYRRLRELRVDNEVEVEGYRMMEVEAF